MRRQAKPSPVRSKRVAFGLGCLIVCVRSRTGPLNFSGSSLVVNVDCGGHGTLRVEAQDAAGKPVECLGLENSVPIWANDLAYTVQWAQAGAGEAERAMCEDGRPCAGHCGDPSIGVRAGLATRLRFVLEDCQLFSFAFV